MKVFIEPAFSNCYQKNSIILADIGASGGLPPHWKCARKHLKTIAFEPDEREFCNLKKNAKSTEVYCNTALFKEKSCLTYYLTKKQMNSSILKPNRAIIDKFPEKDRFDIISTIEMKTDTLDHQLKINNIEDVDFIKVDTEGSELFILEGASSIIKNHVFGIEVEAEFMEIREGQPLFADVDKFLRGQGFHLFDLQNFFWKRKIGKTCGKGRGQIAFGNALYLKTIEDFFQIINAIDEQELKESKILRAIAICSIYGYFDYALEVLDASKYIFKNAEYKIIQDWISAHVSFESRIPDFKGKRAIAKLFYFFWRLVRPSHHGWGSTDRELGNW